MYASCEMYWFVVEKSPEIPQITDRMTGYALQAFERLFTHREPNLHNSDPKPTRMVSHSHKDRFTQPPAVQTKPTCTNNLTAASLTQLGPF